MMEERQEVKKKKSWKADRAVACVLEEPQSVRDFLAEEYSSIGIYLCNLVLQIINIITELCALCTSLLEFEIYCNKLAPVILTRTQLT